MAKPTPRREMFVKEYLIDLNATQAAIRAGYSEKTARSIANELLTKPDIQAAIEKAKQDRMERLEITADRVLQEIAILAFFDPAKVYDMDEGGALTMKSFEDMGIWRRAIAEIKEDRLIKEVKGTKDTPDTEMVLNDKRTLKFHDKSGNLRTLCEHLGILKNQQPLFPPDVTFRFVYACDRAEPKGKS